VISIDRLFTASKGARPPRGVLAVYIRFGEVTKPEVTKPDGEVTKPAGRACSLIGS
jgi:hypothetical protein